MKSSNFPSWSAVSTEGLHIGDRQRSVKQPTSAAASGERKARRIELFKISVGAGHRPVDEDHVAELQESFQRIGLTTPPIVAEDASGVITLIAGQHRVKAALNLGWTHIDAFVQDTNDPKNRLLTLSENLHHLGLSALDRAEQEGEWLQAFQQEAAQVAHPSGGHQPKEQGISKASRKLDVSRRELERAKIIAGISPEAKLKAREFKLHNNQSALLKIAEGKSAEEQLKIAAALVERKKPERKSRGNKADLGRPQTDDIGLPDFLNRRDPDTAFQALLAAWKDAPNLQVAWADAPLAARSRFAAEVLLVESKGCVAVAEKLEVDHAH